MRYLERILRLTGRNFSLQRLGHCAVLMGDLAAWGLRFAVAIYSPTALSQSLTLSGPMSSQAPNSNQENPREQPWIRVNSEISQPKINERKQILAFVESSGCNLRILNLTNGETYLITSEYVGNSFFWAPDHTRLIFTSAIKTPDGPRTTLAAFDLGNKKIVKLDEIHSETGSVSFDPRDNKFFLIHKKGVLTKTLLMSDSRLAKWQSRKEPKTGRFIATSGAITFMKENGSDIEKLKDDNSGVESFEISSDGTSIVWATKSGKIFYSSQGNSPTFLDFGRDPKWHPSKKILVYAGAHRIGRLTSGFDLKISDLDGKKTWLTADRYAGQRWPVWLPNENKILFTKDRTTDLYVMDFSL